MRRIFVAGHGGMVGSAIVRCLEKAGNVDLITKPKSALNLLDTNAVVTFFKNEKVDEVVLAAAKVGGIHANSNYPTQFLFENMQIQNNVIYQAHLADVNRILFLGSSCIYPKNAVQPIEEAALLTGYLESTNEPYAIAKIAGIKLCESLNRQYGRDYRSLMPTNLYGPNDNFHPENSHVVPGLMRRIHEAKLIGAKEVIVWGTGSPRRELLFVDDMADASRFVLDLAEEEYNAITSPMTSHLNVGTGIDYTIRELAQMIKKIVGFSGDLIFDEEKPDGAPQKLLEVSKLKSLGWQYSTSLDEGLGITYEWFTSNA